MPPAQAEPALPEAERNGLAERLGARAVAILAEVWDTGLFKNPAGVEH